MKFLKKRQEIHKLKTQEAKLGESKVIGIISALRSSFFAEIVNG